MSQYSLQRRAMLGGPLWFLGLGAVSRPISAAVQFDVLRNRKIRAIIGGKPGAGTDVMGRAFFAALGRLLPETSINIQTISGGAGAAALEELFQAKGDMIAVSIFGNGPIYSELLLAERLPFDISKLNWLGSIGDSRRLVVVSKTLQVKTFAELAALDRPLIAPSSGAGSPNHIETLLLNSIAGLNLKVVPGFDDGQIDTMLMSGDAQVRLADLSRSRRCLRVAMRSRFSEWVMGPTQLRCSPFPRSPTWQGQMRQPMWFTCWRASTSWAVPSLLRLEPTLLLFRLCARPS